jgi:WD40 repeat protein
VEGGWFQADEQVADLDERVENLMVGVVTGHSNYTSIYALAYDQDLKTLFSGSYDSTVKVWTRDGSGSYTASRTLSGHSDTVRALA